MLRGKGARCQWSRVVGTADARSRAKSRCCSRRGDNALQTWRLHTRGLVVGKMRQDAGVVSCLESES
jgi:hypothetical protein